MADIVFLNVDNLLIHADTIENDGGAPGMRDRGPPLESAVAMPMATNGGAYLHQDLAAMAAAYLFHMCKPHAFIDGSRRAATMAMLTFLDLKGHLVDSAEAELVELTLDVASGVTSKDVLTERVRAVLRSA